MAATADLYARARKMRLYASASGRHGTAAIIDELIKALVESEESVRCQMNLVDYWRAQAGITPEGESDGTT